MPFPTQFPQTALEKLVAHLNGTAPLPLRQAIESVYDVIGYGLAIAIPPDAEAPPMMVMAELTDEQKYEALHAASRAPLAGTIPWATVLPILFELLKRFTGGA